MKTKPKIPDRIVAEVTRNWLEGDGEEPLKSPLLSQRFEHVITTNKERGYDLESWQLTALGMYNTSAAKWGVIETIIAVFVKTNAEKP